MWYLLNPRLWIVVALAGVLVFSHTYAFRKGANGVRLEWAAAKAAATADARKLENERQRHVDDALRSSAARETSDRADAARARRTADGLRNDLDALRVRSEKSLAAALDANRTLGIVFEQCSKALVEMAADADRERNESITLRQSWPR